MEGRRIRAALAPRKRSHPARKTLRAAPCAVKPGGVGILPPRAAAPRSAFGLPRCAAGVPSPPPYVPCRARRWRGLSLPASLPSPPYAAALRCRSRIHARRGVRSRRASVPAVGGLPPHPLPAPRRLRRRGDASAFGLRWCDASCDALRRHPCRRTFSPDCTPLYTASFHPPFLPPKNAPEKRPYHPIDPRRQSLPRHAICTPQPLSP